MQVAEPAILERVLFHVMQEYARHLGQLDVVVELVTGTAGESPHERRSVSDLVTWTAASRGPTVRSDRRPRGQAVPEDPDDEDDEAGCCRTDESSGAAVYVPTGQQLILPRQARPLVAGSTQLGPDLAGGVREIRDRHEHVKVVGSLNLVQTLLREKLLCSDCAGTGLRWCLVIRPPRGPVNKRPRLPGDILYASSHHVADLDDKRDRTRSFICASHDVIGISAPTPAWSGPKGPRPRRSGDSCASSASADMGCVMS